MRRVYAAPQRHMSAGPSPTQQPQKPRWLAWRSGVCGGSGCSNMIAHPLDNVIDGEQHDAEHGQYGDGRHRYQAPQHYLACGHLAQTGES